MQAKTKQPWNWLLFPFSSVKAGDEAVFAASYGYGVYEMDVNTHWGKMDGGLPEHIQIHRLQLQHDTLHACTNKGLYEWTGEGWGHDGLEQACYQYRKIGGTGYAGTDDGIWLSNGSGWQQLDCKGRRVHDFLNLPQYLIVGHDEGVSLYDRFMDDWAHFELKRCITSLAVFRGHVIGATDRGELVVGDKKGRFNRIEYGGLFIFSVVAKGRQVYACTDRGLYKLEHMADRFVLLSIKLGFPVTDMDIQGDRLYLATLFQGIQVVRHPVSNHP